MFGRKSIEMITSDGALPGRDHPLLDPQPHTVLGHPIAGPFPEHLESLVLGMGCFWGAERIFWGLRGVYSTAVGYAGGFTPNPTYEEVCSGRTGHAEVVFVVFDPAELELNRVLAMFWEHHDPTQGMRQGNDIGTQYRSAIYTNSPQQMVSALASRDAFQVVLTDGGWGEITTEIAELDKFYYAEGYHQQYLDKNPNGYDCATKTGVSCPIPRRADG